MPNDDMTLLGEYARNKSEPAFAALVERHVNLVYSVALRLVRDGHMAEEITQAVFIILARKAALLGERVILTGWLCCTTRHVSGRALRDQARRRKREQEAFMQSPADETESADWVHISPLLDTAMDKLGQQDHDAIVLRFFDNKSLAEVGQAMGTSEAAAKMRVNRALDRLRKLFGKHGVALSAAAIAAGMAGNSVKAAPAGLAKSAVALSIAKVPASAASTLTLANAAMKTYTWLTLKFALTGTTFLAAAGVATMLFARSHPTSGGEKTGADMAAWSDTNTFPLDLTGFYMTAGSNFNQITDHPGFGTLPLGRQIFEGVPLRIEGMICLWGGGNSSKLSIDFPEDVSGIPVGQKLESLYVYHAAFFKCPEGSPVWSVVFHYSNGSSATNQLLYGADVLDWIAKGEDGPTDARSRLAWVGGSFFTDRTQPLRVCLTAIENPQPELVVDTIDLVSCKSWTAPCIMAITAGKSGMMP